MKRGSGEEHQRDDAERPFKRVASGMRHPPSTPRALSRRKCNVEPAYSGYACVYRFIRLNSEERRNHAGEGAKAQEAHVSEAYEEAASGR